MYPVPPADDGRRPSLQFRPSEFTRFAMGMPIPGRGIVPFSFRKREYLIPIYDRPSRRALLLFSRQTEKSTTLGNFLLSLAAILPDYKILYVSPSQQQTRTFSQDRIVQPLANSPRLKQYLGDCAPDNVHEKGFLSTRSSIRLRYAYINPERIRGIPADLVALDELQDIAYENVPVIEQTLAHSMHPTHGGWVRMSGTPKSLDNTLSYYWEKSSQSELKIPCERHGLPSRPHTWYWVTVGETNIGRHGLICDKCGAPLDRFHPMRGWVDTVPGQKIQGYRVPQMLAPTLQDHEWDEKVIYPYETYPRAQFFNEVLALPFEAGTRPISKGEIINCCDPEWKMSREQIAEALTWHASSEIFAGIDYTGGEHSWTVLALGSYHGGDKFRIFYMHRFTGLEAAPDMQARLLVEVFRRFNVRVSFGDWGGGMHANHVLMKAFGPRRHNVLEYVPRAKKRLYYNIPRNRWIGEKRDLVAAVFNALKERRIILPAWDVFETYGQDILNITIEHNPVRNQSLYAHHPNKPDDSFHAILYCLLASTLLVPRPDIFHSIDPKQTYDAIRTRFDD